MSYAQWCDKYKFLYADRIIPEDWLKEKSKKWNKNIKKIQFKLKKVRRK